MNQWVSEEHHILCFLSELRGECAFPILGFLLLPWECGVKQERLSETDCEEQREETWEAGAP